MIKCINLSHKLVWAGVLTIIFSGFISAEMSQASVYLFDLPDIEAAGNTCFVSNAVICVEDEENIEPTLKRQASPKKVLPSKKVKYEPIEPTEEVLWDFLEPRFKSKKTFQALHELQPNPYDLLGLVKTNITVSALKRDTMFSETSFTDEEKNVLNLFGGSYLELNTNLYSAQENCSPLKKNPEEILKENTIAVTPVARKYVSRTGLNDFTNTFKKTKNSGFPDTKKLIENRSETRRKLDAYANVLKAEYARATYEQQEQERISGLSRAQAGYQLKCLQEYGTVNVFNNFFAWLKKQAPSKLSRSDINEYFIAHMAFLFSEIQVEGIRFFYNPMDINANLRDSKKRSNLARLFSGLNPVYDAPGGKFKIFDWHHIAQEQLPHGSIVVCIPKEIHSNPLLHPFNDEGSQINRKLFSVLKQEANQLLAQQTFL